MKKFFESTSILLFIILGLFYAPKVLSQTTDKEEVFQPHMLDHKNQGCPTNSTCSAKLGLKMKEWTELLTANKAMAAKNIDALNNFIRQHGLPLEFWLVPPMSDEQIISWDSACQEHQKEGQIVDIGMVFTKAYNQTQLLAEAPAIKLSLMVDQVFVQDNKKIEIYPRLRGQMPAAFEDQHFVYIQDLEGVYWSLNVSQKGALMLGPTISAPSLYEVDCPPELVSFAQKNPPRKLIYQSFFCKRMSNIQGTKNVIVMFPFACD